MTVPGRSALDDLHDRIAACQRCADLLDPTKARRVSASGPMQSELFVVSQALARDTQRESGIPFVLPDGHLSGTGKTLEKFLNRIGFSLLPPQAIAFAGGELPAAMAGMRQAYNSEILQCYPGRTDGASGDRFPVEAARRCLDEGFLASEIALLDPKLILLLGTKTASEFARRFCPARGKVLPVTKLLEAFDPTVAIYEVEIGGARRRVISLIHPSGLTRALFKRLVLENDALCDSLRGVLGAAR